MNYISGELKPGADGDFEQILIPENDPEALKVCKIFFHKSLLILQQLQAEAEERRALKIEQIAARKALETAEMEKLAAPKNDDNVPEDKPWIFRAIKGFLVSSSKTSFLEKNFQRVENGFGGGQRLQKQLLDLRAENCDVKEEQIYWVETQINSVRKGRVRKELKLLNRKNKGTLGLKYFYFASLTAFTKIFENIPHSTYHITISLFYHTQSNFISTIIYDEIGVVIFNYFRESSSRN